MSPITSSYSLITSSKRLINPIMVASFMLLQRHRCCAPVLCTISAVKWPPHSSLPLGLIQLVDDFISLGLVGIGVVGVLRHHRIFCSCIYLERKIGPTHSNKHMSRIILPAHCTQGESILLDCLIICSCHSFNVIGLSHLSLSCTLHHCHWHGEILAFTSFIPLRSRRVTTITRWLYLVPFHHLFGICSICFPLW